jgi:hypothetical protein
MHDARDTGRTRPETNTNPKRPSGVFAQHPVRPDPGTGFHTCPKAGSANTTADDARDTHPVTLASPRRGLLTGTIASLLTGTAAVATARAAPRAASGDDAELLRLCAEMVRLRAVADAIGAEAASLPDGDEEDHEQRYSLADHEWFVAVRDVADTPARTLAGVRAKASVMLSMIEELVFTGHVDTLDDIAAGNVGEDEDRMAPSLARDIMALEVVA